MVSGSRRASLLLFIGDFIAFALSLWVTLFLRYGEVPAESLFFIHFWPFLPLFASWLLIFYMSGLYGKRIILFKSRLPNAIFKTQLFNIGIAALFFFMVPSIGITPKIVLMIYLVVSLGAIFLWRLFIFPKITSYGTRERAALIAAGSEADELRDEVNSNNRYHLEFKVVETPEGFLKTTPEEFATRLRKEKITTIVIDTEHDALRSVLPQIYELSLVKRKYQLAEFYLVYEEVFDRVPLSLLRYEWFLKNVSHPTFGLYAVLKRAVDVAGAIAMGGITAIAVPFVWIAMRLEGKGPLFIAQERIGLRGVPVRAYKFRSMTQNKAASGEWTTEEAHENKVTKVGAFLRITSLDEFPQFVNVLRGEISLIGPRNDIEGLGRRLAEAIPYYNVRYVVKPGITGWAQINQQYEQGKISPQSIEETKMRLAYDFYYIKNRSFVLDMEIALKTLKRMLFRVSSW